MLGQFFAIFTAFSNFYRFVFCTLDESFFSDLPLTSHELWLLLAQHRSSTVGNGNLYLAHPNLQWIMAFCILMLFRCSVDLVSFLASARKTGRQGCSFKLEWSKPVWFNFFMCLSVRNASVQSWLPVPPNTNQLLLFCAIVCISRCYCNIAFDDGLLWLRC